MFENKDRFTELIDFDDVVALIPARGGSKGVPWKNIQLLNGYPLIAYSIAVSLNSAIIRRTIVTTDSDEIAKVSRKFGAEVPFLRPKEYASDNSGDIEFVEHFIKYMAENENHIPEYIVHLRPTTPLRRVDIMDVAIKKCIESKECNSLRSAHKASESPFKWFLKTEKGYFSSINKGISNDEANGVRQSFPDVFIPDGYVDVLKASYVIENDKLHGEKLLAFESPVCSEVDTLEDFEYLKYDLNKNGSDLMDYLIKYKE